MMLSLSNLLPLVGQSFQAPRPTFARLRQLQLPREVLWQALLLVVVLSVLLAEVSAMLFLSTGTVEADAQMIISPAVFGVVQFSLLVAMIFAIHYVGRAMGGTGDFAGAILLVVWLQFVMVCLQVVQSVAMFVMPPLAGLVLIAGLVLFMWLLTNFVAELHGFDGLGKVFAMILFTMLGFALGLTFLMTLLGVTVPR
ncbi:YIP1 family protein [Rhodobacteraceae bacterium CCMM004]|nr:YIP1 family protein [Rhodobacteraceae bacterium CCMM004]